MPNTDPKGPLRDPMAHQLMGCGEASRRGRDLVKVEAGDDVRPLGQLVHLLQEVHVPDVCVQIKKQ